MIIGLVRQFAVKGTLTESLRSLFTDNPFERITNSIAPSVKALVTATEKKIHSTLFKESSGFTVTFSHGEYQKESTRCERNYRVLGW
jgi:hypothetical protein